MTNDKLTKAKAAAYDDLCDTIDKLNDRLVAAHQRIAALEKELADLKLILSNPTAVWINILRGVIARPAAIEHYGELKQRVEILERELSSAETPPPSSSPNE